MKKIFSLILVSFLLLSFILPFNVFADVTYIEAGTNACYVYSVRYDTSVNRSINYYSNGNDVRGVQIQDTNSTYTIFVSLANAKTNMTQGNYSPNECYISGTPNSNNGTTRTYNNLTYYTWSVSWGSVNVTSSDFPVFTQINGLDVYATAYRYTFGDLSDNTEPINLGDLILGFYTKFAGSGNSNNDIAWRNNLDTITWDNIDTNGNVLEGVAIELRAVPATLSGTTKTNLYQKLFTDWVIEAADAYTLGFYSITSGQASFTWEYVSNIFSPVWSQNYGDGWNLRAFNRQESWHKVGWIYQARLVDIDDNSTALTNWQTIYNATTTDAESSDQLENNPTMSPETINNINNINNYNNTTNNYYIDNTEVNVSNSDGTQSTDKPWWSYLLEAIVSLLNNLLDILHGVFSDVLEGIFNLINSLGVNILQTFTNLWNGLMDLLNDIDVVNIDLDIPDLSPYAQLVPRTLEIFIGNGFGLVIWIPLIICIVELII